MNGRLVMSSLYAFQSWSVFTNLPALLTKKSLAKYDHDLKGYSIPVFIGLAAADTDKPPTWPKKYTICGTLQLPYAEIKEPFCGYYDSESNKSRIDYYPGERPWKSRWNQQAIFTKRRNRFFKRRNRFQISKQCVWHRTMGCQGVDMSKASGYVQGWWVLTYPHTYCGTERLDHLYANLWPLSLIE